MAELTIPIIIYADGAAEPNPGVGGWACILMLGNRAKEIYGFTPGPAANNQMELAAIHNALLHLKGEGLDLEIRSDSQWDLNAISGAWNISKNVEQVRKIQSLIEEKKFKIKWTWVRSHSGEPHNERCDYMAITALRKKKAGMQYVELGGR